MMDQAFRGYGEVLWRAIFSLDAIAPLEYLKEILDRNS